MDVKKEEEIDYIKKAFTSNWNLLYITVIGLIGLGVGIYTPVFVYLSFLGVGIFGEVVYLGIMSNHPKFRKHVRSQMKSRDNESNRKEIYDDLSRSSQKRYYKLHEIKKDIQVNYKKLDYTSQGILNSHIEKIEGILDSYLRLLHQSEHYKSLADDNTEDNIRDSIEELKEDMSDDSDRVRKMKEKRLNVLEKRASRFERAKENLEIINTQVGTIEDAMVYIHEESWTLQDPEQVTFQLDNLLSRVEETQEVIHTNSIVDSSFEEDLKALDQQLQSSTEENLDLNNSSNTQKVRQ